MQPEEHTIWNAMIEFSLKITVEEAQMHAFESELN